MSGADARYDADADDGDVAGNAFPVVEHRRVHPVELSFEADEPRREPYVHALARVLLGIEAREVFSRHPRKQAVEHFNHRNPAAQLAQHRGRFEADIAAAHHHHVARAAFEFGHQPVDIGLVAHGVNAA